MSGGATWTARFAAGIAAASAALAPAGAQASGPQPEKARAAIEDCLTRHPQEAWRCLEAAAPYCGATAAAACRRFEIGVWRELAARADDRLAAAYGGATESRFAQDAAQDAAAHSERLCAQRSQDRAPAERGAAEWTCRRDAQARRAAALWLIAPRP